MNPKGLFLSSRLNRLISWEWQRGIFVLEREQFGRFRSMLIRTLEDRLIKRRCWTLLERIFVIRKLNQSQLIRTWALAMKKLTSQSLSIRLSKMTIRAATWSSQMTWMNRRT